MAKKKAIDLSETKRPAYGERPEPVTCEPCEPKPMYIPIPEENQEKEKVKKK